MYFFLLEMILLAIVCKNTLKELNIPMILLRKCCNKGNITIKKVEDEGRKCEHAYDVTAKML